MLIFLNRFSIRGGKVEVMIRNDIEQAFISRSNENSYRYRNVTILDSNLTRSERVNAARCRSIRRDRARAITEFRGTLPQDVSIRFFSPDHRVACSILEPVERGHAWKHVGFHHVES